MKHKINFSHSKESIIKVINQIYAYDLAMMYQQLDIEKKNKLLDMMPFEKLVEVFIELDAHFQLEAFSYLNSQKQISLLRQMDTDEIKSFILLYDDEKDKEKLLLMLSPIKRKTVQLLLTFDENQAASIMKTEFISININQTIKEATHDVIVKSKDQDYIDTVFVENENHVCVGLIDLQSLIIARQNDTIEKIMNKDFLFVLSNDTIEDAIQYVLDYDRNVLPVLDENHHIMGIITADDIFDELIEDYEEDYEAFYQISDHDRSFSAFKRARMRMPWLLIGIVLNLFTITILSLFSHTLEQITILVLFQPMILGMAGNIGTQALAVTILGIHQKEYKDNHNAKKHIRNEVLIGGFNSVIVGGIGFFFVFIYVSLLNLETFIPFDVAVTVSVSLTLAMFISSFIGSFSPIMLNKLNIDPAFASGPILTTINDIISLVIYFGLATLMFSNML